MTQARPVIAFARAIALTQKRIGPSLRSLVLFGSCLSPRTRTRSSIPDLFAIVDDVDTTLVRLGVGTLGRWAARILPPITLSLREDGASLAKLNLVEAHVVTEQLAARRDLYLAARFAKKTVVVFARDASCAAEVAALTHQAATVTASVALLARPRSEALAHVVQRCISVSYEAEPRPERPAKVAALFDAFADEYRARFTPLVVAEASRLGIRVSASELIDERADDIRAREARTLRRLLRRSRLRMMARWPKQMLVYRGWLQYLVQKLQRAWLTA